MHTLYYPFSAIGHTTINAGVSQGRKVNLLSGASRYAALYYSIVAGWTLSLKKNKVGKESDTSENKTWFIKLRLSISPKKGYV